MVEGFWQIVGNLSSRVEERLLRGRYVSGLGVVKTSTDDDNWRHYSRGQPRIDCTGIYLRATNNWSNWCNAPIRRPASLGHPTADAMKIHKAALNNRALTRKNTLPLILTWPWSALQNYSSAPIRRLMLSPVAAPSITHYTRNLVKFTHMSHYTTPHSFSYSCSYSLPLPLSILYPFSNEYVGLESSEILLLLLLLLCRPHKSPHPFPSFSPSSIVSIPGLADSMQPVCASDFD